MGALLPRLSQPSLSASGLGLLSPRDFTCCPPNPPPNEWQVEAWGSCPPSLPASLPVGCLCVPKPLTPHRRKKVYLYDSSSLCVSKHQAKAPSGREEASPGGVPFLAQVLWSSSGLCPMRGQGPGEPFPRELENSSHRGPALVSQMTQGRPRQGQAVGGPRAELGAEVRGWVGVAQGSRPSPEE